MTGIKHGDHVTLKVSGDEYAARVQTVGEGHIVLGLARRPDEPLVFGTEATVEAAGAGGFHDIIGMLDPDRREPDLVTLRCQEVENVQRRQFVRVDATCMVEVRRRGRDPIQTFTVNVSGSGFLLAGPDDLDEGEEMGLTVKLGDGQELRIVKAEVVRVTADGFRGVHILDIEEAERERLVQYVFERQRVTPRVTLQ
jgi:hypothetical protein